MGANGFLVDVDIDGHDATVKVCGEIDMATAPVLRERLQSLRTVRVTIDLSEVTFIDSIGLSVLASATRHAESELRFRGVRPFQRRLLELTGLDGILLTADGVDGHDGMDGTTPNGDGRDEGERPPLAQSEGR